MLLNNFRKFLAGYAVKGENFKITDTTGTEVTTNISISDNIIGNVIFPRIGSGTTEPTADDYALENAIDMSPAGITVTTERTFVNNVLTITRTFTNTSSNTFYIGEAAAIVGSGVTSTGVEIALTRDLIDINLAPSETLTITWTFNFNEV